VKLLSIITISYNDLSGLQFTLASSKSFDERVEWIIVDGGSTDGTQQFLSELSEDYLFSSEPDEGLYDAMNKGLKEATGEYVIFMNSGDGFHSEQTLKEILSSLEKDKPDVLYGETMYQDEARKNLGIRSEVTTRKLPKSLHWKMLINGMLVCHQSFVAKKELVPFYKLNNLSADYDWMISVLKNSKTIQNAKMIIANYLIGGVSSQRKFKSLKDRFAIMANNFGMIRTLFSHLMMIPRQLKQKITSSNSY